MKLTDLFVPTAVATPGMAVSEVFRECVDKQVPGIPFRDSSGRIVGKASIRHVLKETCIPDFMVRHAGLLGDHIESLTIPAAKAQRLLQLTIDPFVLSDTAVINSEAPISKALAVMERHDTTYLFVIDDDRYFGVVSIMGIGKAVLQYDSEAC